jgi:hypothetical protein
MAMLERRRAALAAEGLFDEGRKQPLPFLPEVIGVVTSPSGAVIRDILHRLRDRFPRHVLIWPVAVQGAACAPEVARAIRGFNALPEGGPIPRPDVLIVARGGGSLEDLWGFNEEAVVRAAAESVIPLISAVGHETDTTLIDYASDRRAPTPTAAAEMAVPVRLDLLNWVRQQDGYMTRAARQGVATRRQRLGDLSRGLPRPEMLLEAPRQRLDRAVLQLGPRCGRRHRCGGGSWTGCRRGSNRRWSARWRGGGWSSGAWRGSCGPPTLRNRSAGSGIVWASWRGVAPVRWPMGWRGGRDRLDLAGAAACDAGLRGDAAPGLRGGAWRRPCRDEGGRCRRARRGWRSSSPTDGWPCTGRAGSAPGPEAKDTAG